MKNRVLIYDSNARGHCPGWVHLVATGFRRQGVDVWVYCQADQPQVRPWARSMVEEGCRVLGIPPDVGCQAAHAAEGARSHGIRRIFFPNFDSIVYDLGKKGIPPLFDGMDIGGIWLRPELSGPRRGPVRKLLEKLVRTRGNKLRRQHARAVLNNIRGLETFLPAERRMERVRLFFTSGQAAEEVSDLLSQGETVRICDPWLNRCEVPRAEARKALGLDGERMVFLHLGTTRPEKGLKDACRAFLRLDPALLGRACLLRAGLVDKGDILALQALKDRGAARLIDRYVEEEELGLCYAAADWVLLPYRHQKESSGVLVHAAANRRPVIVSDYGMIGDATKKYGLGQVFAHGRVSALATVLTQVISDGPYRGWAEEGMVEFANLNSPGEFQRTLIEQWLTS